MKHTNAEVADPRFPMAISICAVRVFPLEASTRAVRRAGINTENSDDELNDVCLYRGTGY